MFGPGSDHPFVGYWEDSSAGGKDLAFFLFACVDGQGEAGVDACVEVGHVVIQVRLADLGVCGENMLDKRAEVDTVEAFHWVGKDSIVDVVDGHGKLVTHDG